MASKKTSLTQLTQAFYSGKYKSVLSQLDSKNLKLSEDETFLKIGSLVFLGDVDEAQFLYDAAKTNSSDLFHLRCRFYLGIGNVRRSQYTKATRHFAQNLSISRKLKSSREDIFYAYQGAAFFHFFKGQYALTKRLAFQAYDASYKSDFLYGQVLSLDLLGHASCQLGAIRQGLHELEKALTLSRKIGNGGIETALQISLVKYKAQFGIDIKNTVSDLLNAVDQLNPQDTYSRAELFLELSRQYLLRGQGQEAQKVLESASELIYKHQNRRQSATYNLRFAHLLFLKGESHTARALIQSQRMSLDAKIDRAILQQLRGIEEKISGSQADSALSLTYIDQRIRTRSSKKIKTNHSEDPLGDAIDNSHDGGLLALNKIKDLKLFGLIPKFFKVSAGSSVLILGPHRSEIIAVSGADVFIVNEGITAPMKTLLQYLQGPNYKTKKQLIENTWGYEYSGETHDRLLHATIAKIRAKFGPLATWIEWSNAGYRLDPNVTLVMPNGLHKEKISTKNAWPTEPTARPIRATELNERQLKTLSHIRKGVFIGVTDYAKTYRICKMTACRDLTHLLKLGLVIKVGRARATKYGDLESI